MSDCISRQKLIASLNNTRYDSIINHTYTRESVMGVILHADPEDVRPNIHATWEKPTGKIQPFGEDTRQCTGCGFFTEKDSCYIYNFCPICGCKMDGAEPER